MADEYSKYKLFRKYKTEDGVNYTPLDEYQALYESGDGVDCSCGYRKYEWVESGKYECGSIKEIEITQNTTFYFDDINQTSIVGESASIVEIVIPKGYYNKEVTIGYHQVNCCDGGYVTKTLVENGEILLNDTFYAIRYEGSGATKSQCNGYELFTVNVGENVVLSEPIKIKLYNGRLSKILNEKKYCPTDSSYDELTGNVKRGDIYGLSFDCGYGGHYMDLDSGQEYDCGSDLYPKIEITRIDGDWNYEYNSDYGTYYITSSFIELKGETTARIYFKLSKPSNITLYGSSICTTSYYKMKISDIDSDISNASDVTYFEKTFTILDTDEHYVEIQYNKTSLVGDYSNIMNVTLKLSTDYNYNEKLYKYDIVKYDVNDTNVKEKLDYFIYKNKLVKLSEIDTNTPFKTFYFSKYLFNEIETTSIPFTQYFSTSPNNTDWDGVVVRYYPNTGKLDICDYHCSGFTEVNDMDIYTFTYPKNYNLYKIDTDRYNETFLNGIYVQPLTVNNCPCGYDSIEYIPSDDDEIIDGEDLFYYMDDITPLHTYRKVQGYKMCNGVNIGKHIGDYQYQIYEENKYYYDFTMGIVGSGKNTSKGLYVTPNYVISGEYYNRGQSYVVVSSTLDEGTIVVMPRSCNSGVFTYWYPLYSINSIFNITYSGSLSNMGDRVKSVRLPSFKHLIDCGNAFYSCSYLETVDATYTNVIPSQITNTSGMFNYCSSLKTLILGNVTQEQYDWWYQRLVDAGIQDNVTITYNIV